MKRLLTILTVVGMVLAGSGHASATVLWGCGSPDWLYGSSGPSPVIFMFDTSTGTISKTFSFGTTNGNFMWISGIADSGDYLYASHNIYDIAKSSNTHDFKIAKIDRTTGAVLSDTAISGFLGQTYSQVNALDLSDGKLYAVENATSGSTIRGYAMEIVLDANGDVTGATPGAFVGPYPDCGLDYHDGLWWATSWGYTPLGNEGSLVFTSPDIMNTAFTQVGTGDSAVEGIGMIDGWEYACGYLFAVTWYNVPASSTAVYSINTSTWTATSLYDLSSQLPASITALDGLSNLPAPAEVWVDDDYCDGCSNGGHIWCYDAFNNIQDGIDTVAAGGTVNVAAGTYNVDTTIVVNKPVTIIGSSGGGAVVNGITAAVSVFEIRASNVTIQNLEITHSAMPPYPPPAPLPAFNELVYSLIRVPINLGLSGIAITDNTIYVPAQSGAMSTWGGIAICVGSGTTTGTGISITGNTIYNTRNGVVVQYNNTATISSNIIYDTKGGIMNYTNTQADADKRTISNNSWGTAWAHSEWPDIEGTHNEWDIVWNTAYYTPDYQQSVLALSGTNNNGFVLDRRAGDASWTPAANAAACAALTSNRSHIFVDDDSTLTAPHPAKGNFNEPFATIQLGIDAVVPGGSLYIAGGTYYETNVNVTKSLVITGKVGDCPGPDPGAPILDGGGANADGFVIAPGVDNVTIEGFFIRNFGVSPTSAGVGVGVKAYGTSTDPTTNVTVRFNQFDNNIWANAFFYNEGQSLFDAIDVNCNVVNMGPWSPNTNVYGIECTNCTNSSISDNEVSGGWDGILMTLQAYAGRTVTAGGNSITNNTVSNSGDTNIFIVPWLVESGGPAPTMKNISVLNNRLTNANKALTIVQYTGVLQNFTITGNEITVVSPPASNYVVQADDVAGASTFSDNTVVLSGTSPPGSPSFFHGLNLGGGASGNWTIQSNVFAGNNDVGANSVGIRLRGSLPPTSTLNINCNRVTGWKNGIQSDALANAGLVTVYDNSIAGNSTNGFFDNSSATAIDAEDNWWGCTSGPGGSGCDTVAGNVDFTPWALSVPPCVSCSEAADCDDGLACNGAETCNLEVCQAGTPVDCSYLTDQCNTGVCEEPAGTCMADPLPDGTFCDDGDICSIPDQCQSGVCTPGGGGDSDSDGICDIDDNCPAVANPGQEDADGDEVGDACNDANDFDDDEWANGVDNCPGIPNSSVIGTCVTTKAGLVVSYRVGEPKGYIYCITDADCTETGGTCQMEQGDCNGNGVGNVCECYANFNYPVSPTDLRVNASDLAIYKEDYGRIDCSEIDPCRADGSGDGKVNMWDLMLYKNEYGRIDCPAVP